MKKRPYNNVGADRLADHVRKRYGQEMTNSDKHVYFTGARFLERKTAALCEIIVKPVGGWQQAAGVSVNTVGKALRHCFELGLIDYHPGQAVLGGAASQVRRRTIAELETGVSETVLRSHTPVMAQELVERLKGRRFTYGSSEISPALIAAKTGRIYMRHPCPQTDPADLRRERLAEGLAENQILIEVDFRQTEPTIAKHLLAEEHLFPAKWPKDIYQELASHLGQPRDDVKGLVMAGLLNAHSSSAHIHKWGVLPGTFLHELAEALDEYKTRLWSRSKPRAGKRRHVRTLGGTLVEALKGERLHKGKLLSWQIQGTVADILNAAIGEILDLEHGQDWRFLFQVYDSVYVAGKSEQAKHVAAIMEQHARGLNVCLATAIRTRHQGRIENG